MGVDIDRIAADLRRGLIPAEIYNDAEVHAAERERLFPRSWVFVAHESEIPYPGDYVVRSVLDDSFIIARDEHGQLRALYNMCLHRGMQVCRAEMGNASHFRCPYHGWSYRNDGQLVGVPFHQEAYGGEAGLCKADLALLQPGKLGVYDGLVFVNMDGNAPDLADYLGGFRFYLDLYLRQSEAGAEVFGPQRWRIDADWKIAAENFSGDSYHTPHTHRSIVDIGLFGEPKANKRKQGALYFADVGGGTTYKLPPGGFADGMRHVGYPDEMIARAERTWTAQQRALVGDAGFMVSAATLMPNLSLVHNWPQVDEDGLVVPFISLRLWQPLGPGQCEVHSWFVVDRQAPQWFKDASYKAYLMSFGSSGMFEQDDVENWTSITHVAGGRMARSLRLQNHMGLDEHDKPLREPLADWPGPGQAYQGFGEYNQRALLDLWRRYLQQPAPVEEPA